jgi:hypothetical protein
MAQFVTTPARFHWAHLPTLALGIFLGAFWIIAGWLWRLSFPGPWWLYATTLAPGAAILLLVLLARRQPVPYGAGLAALGVVVLLLPNPRTPWLVRLFFGLPIFLNGAAFLIWREQLQDAAQPRNETGPGSR